MYKIGSNSERDTLVEEEASWGLGALWEQIQWEEHIQMLLSQKWPGSPAQSNKPEYSLDFS